MKKKYELLLNRLKISLSVLRSKRHPYATQNELEFKIINIKSKIKYYEHRRKKLE